MIIYYNNDFDSKDNGVIYARKRNFDYRIGTFNNIRIDSLIETLNRMYFLNLSSTGLEPPITDCIVPGSNTDISINLKHGDTTISKSISLNPACMTGPHMRLYNLLREWSYQHTKIVNQDFDKSNYNTYKAIIESETDLKPFLKLYR